MIPAWPSLLLNSARLDFGNEERLAMLLFEITAASSVDVTSRLSNRASTLPGKLLL